MHAFRATLPAKYLGNDFRPRDQVALVICGCYPGQALFYGWVGALVGHDGCRRELRREGLTLGELLAWLSDLGIVRPGGLLTHLVRDAQAPPQEPLQRFIWGEQGPELVSELPRAAA